MVLILAALLVAAHANTGAVERLDASGGAVWAEDVEDVSIAAELVWLRIDRVGGAPVATWGVAYDFDNRAGAEQVHQVVFPVEAWLGRGVIGFECTAATEQVTLALADVLDGRKDLAGAVEALRARSADGCHELLPDGFAALAGALEGRAGPLRVEVGPGDLAAAAVLDLVVLQDGAEVPISGAVLELEPSGMGEGGEEDQDDHHARMWTDLEIRPGAPPPERIRTILAPPVEATALVGFPLRFPPGRSRVVVRYRAPVPSFGSWGYAAHATSYVLGSGRTWAGPIGALQVRVDRSALRGRVPPSLPFEAPAALDSGALTWTTTGYEPAVGDRIWVGGQALFAFQPVSVREPVLPEQALDPLWQDPMAAGLPAGEPRASAADPSPAWVPLFMDGVQVRDLGFGPASALDGGLSSAWCAPVAPGRPATLSFTLARPAEALELHPGWPVPWRLGSCEEAASGDRAFPVHPPPPGTSGACVLPDPSGPSRTAPTRVRVEADGGAPVSRDVQGLDPLVLRGPFPAGETALEVHGDGRACIAEITVHAARDPVFGPLADDLAPLMTAPE